MPYVKQTWTDGVSALSAARMGVMEQGIYDAHFPPAARVYHNANQAITTGTGTALAFNSERFDTDTIHDTSTNNSRLTCKTAGTYLIVGQVTWEAVAAGAYRRVWIRHSSSDILAEDMRAPTSGGDAKATVTTTYALAVNDYAELFVAHDRGSNLNIVASSPSSPEFMMVRVA